MPPPRTEGALQFAGQLTPLADRNLGRSVSLTQDRLNVLLGKRQQIFAELDRIRRERQIKKQEAKAERAQEASAIGAGVGLLAGGVGGGLIGGTAGAFTGAGLGSSLGQQIGSAAGGGSFDAAAPFESYVPNPFFDRGSDVHEGAPSTPPAGTVRRGRASGSSAPAAQGGAQGGGAGPLNLFEQSQEVTGNVFDVAAGIEGG